MTREEFNKCADSLSDNVYRFVRKAAGDADTAKDIVQDAFEKLWAKHSDIDFMKAKPYLFTCAYNGVIDFFRRGKNVFSEIGGPVLNSVQDTYRQFDGLKEALSKALRKLPAEQRSVMLLRDYEGYSYDEIAQITGLSLSAVKVYIFRGRVAMKRQLETAGITADNF
jgi:RNA polymerase sigma-70 factor (ECF subfamily)